MARRHVYFRHPYQPPVPACADTVATVATDCARADAGHCLRRTRPREEGSAHYVRFSRFVASLNTTPARIERRQQWQTSPPQRSASSSGLVSNHANHLAPQPVKELESLALQMMEPASQLVKAWELVKEQTLELVKGLGWELVNELTWELEWAADRLW